MKFFTRCKILKRVLSVLEVILGIILGFQVYDIILSLPLTDAFSDPSIIPFWLTLIPFGIILLAIILLNCVIKDAEEDLGAVMRLSENSKDKE